MIKRSLLNVLVAVIFIGGGLVLIIWNETRPTTIDPTAQASQTTNESFTLSEIAEHNQATSCWTAIEGNVYDMTEYIEAHPGGVAPILAVCGRDGTEVFLSMPSAVLPVARLGIAKFKIGTLRD